ncbi:MAG: hemerythrin [Gammaproteobacteria bacterium]|jgi:hemerythrin|nr:hemerythrin [Gammaproteobacteria bacterium]
MSAPLIDPTEPRFRLDLDEMDQTHLEFIDLVNRLAAADDAGSLALHEHRGEHRRVLAELRGLGRRAANGRPALARAYVREQLPHWFALHAATMDSALAGHLKAGSSG